MELEYPASHCRRYLIPKGNQLNGPCLYLKTNTGYAGREIKCENKYHYVCKWTPHECPGKLFTPILFESGVNYDEFE